MASISQLLPHSISPSPIPTKSLEWIDDLKIEKYLAEGSSIKKQVTNWQLKGTPFSITSDNEAGKWENRFLFIKQALGEIFSNCPKKEKLLLISNGSSRLLMEYILGKALIEEGYDLSFFLIDPIYSFASEKKKESFQFIMKQFREQMGSIFHKKHQTSFPEGDIRFLSRAPNIAKYFPEGANVVFLEILPPYGEILRQIEEKKAPQTKPQNLLAGNLVVPVEHANAVAFIPKQHLELAKQNGGKFMESLPLPIFQNTASKTHFYFNWGCKISKDGTYNIDFSSEDDFVKSLNLSGKKIQLSNSEIISTDQWLTKIKSLLENTLFTAIKQIQFQSPVKEFSQEQISNLLKNVEQVFLANMPGAHSFFLRDYALDRFEAISHIACHGGNYRNAFMLVPDSCTAGYKITIEDIK